MVAVGDIVYPTDLDEYDRVRWVAGGALTGSAGPTVGTTELAVLTIGSATYEANTAYKFIATGPASVSTGTNSPLFRVRKTNTGGQQLDGWRTLIATGAVHGTHYTGYFQVGGSAVAAALCLTMNGTAGYTVSIGASGTAPCTLNVYRVGDAADFSWAPTLA